MYMYIYMSMYIYISTKTISMSFEVSSALSSSETNNPPQLPLPNNETQCV